MEPNKTTLRLGGEEIPAAAALLAKGELVAVPTETVYGLAAHAGQDQAVRHIYAIKGRNPGKPLSLLVSGMEMAAEYVQNIPPAAYRLAETYWPARSPWCWRTGDRRPPPLPAGGPLWGSAARTTP